MQVAGQRYSAWYGRISGSLGATRDPHGERAVGGGGLAPGAFFDSKFFGNLMTFADALRLQIAGQRYPAWCGSILGPLGAVRGPHGVRKGGGGLAPGAVLDFHFFSEIR